MIEQALYFAIGFLVAALAGVVWTPIVSRRATRLAEARARLQAPISERQAIAERDALRAEHAVEQVRLERRLTLAEETSIGLRAEVGRHSVRIIALEADAAHHRTIDFDRRAEIDELRSECRSLEAALGASQSAIHDLMAQRDRAHGAEAAAISREKELEAEANRARAKAAIEAARADSLEGQYSELSRFTAATAERAESVRVQLANSLTTMSANAKNLDERLRETIARNDSLAQSASGGDAARDENRRRLADLESRLSASERVREETLIENGRQLAALAEGEAALRNALAKTVELEGRLAQAPEAARAAESAASLKTETLTGAHGAMEESLRAALSEREALQRENEALKARTAALGPFAVNGADDAALRESIQRLGREVSRLFSAQKSTNRDNPGANDRLPPVGPEAPPREEPSIEVRPAFVESPARRVARSRAPDR